VVILNEVEKLFRLVLLQELEQESKLSMPFSFFLLPSFYQSINQTPSKRLEMKDERKN